MPSVTFKFKGYIIVHVDCDKEEAELEARLKLDDIPSNYFFDGIEELRIVDISDDNDGVKND